MIAHGFHRRRRLDADNIYIMEADALNSPIPDASQDAVICVYGVKTLSPYQQEQFVAEVRRILKDGGVFGLVEVSVPRFALLRTLYMFYLCYLVPVVGLLLLGSPESYRMLGRYMQRFGDCRELVEIFAEEGFDARYESFFFGCATGITGTKRSHGTITT
jgi:demethylmenaquinone methyltransferase/2-methoxy-6-polyprenyl-1,4-benzoquinol methylase